MQKLKTLGAPRWLIGSMQPTTLRIDQATAVVAVAHEARPDYADSVAARDWPAGWML